MDGEMTRNSKLPQILRGQMTSTALCDMIRIVGHIQLVNSKKFRTQLAV